MNEEEKEEARQANQVPRFASRVLEGAETPVESPAETQEEEEKKEEGRITLGFYFVIRLKADVGEWTYRMGKPVSLAFQGLSMEEAERIMKASLEEAKKKYPELQSMQILGVEKVAVEESDSQEGRQAHGEKN